MSHVMLIGDSIRMAYAPKVRSLLGDAAEIIEIPENGGDSANVLSRLPAWLAELGNASPPRVWVNCGLHDIKRAYGSDVRQVGLDEYTRNVRSILESLRDTTGGRVVWATTTPVVYERHHATKGFDRFDSDVLDYNAAAADVAAALSLPAHDLYAVVAAAGVMTCVGEDGVHMTEQGAQVLADAVAERLLTGI